MRALESIAICRPADAATGSTRGVSTLGHRKRLSGRSRRQALLPDQRRACSGITPILSMRLSAAVSVGQGGSAPADEIADGNRSMLSEGAKAARPDTGGFPLSAA